MERQDPNPASAKEQAEGSRENVNVGREHERRTPGDVDLDRKGLHGKTDSGPEPDVHNRELPPQE